MAEDLYKKRMIGLKVIRKKVKELDKRISGMDDPIKKSKLSKQRDKAIGRIDSRLKMKNFGFGTKAGVTRKRNEFLNWMSPKNKALALKLEKEFKYKERNFHRIIRQNKWRTAYSIYPY